MSIREALERGPDDSQRTIVELYDRSIHNQRLALEIGVRFLNEARVPQLLQELAEIIKPDFADVRVTEPRLMANFNVHTELRWNFRREQIVGEEKEPVCDSVIISAEILSGDLTVGRGEIELLTRNQWSSHPQRLEDAIVKAYRAPLITGLRLHRL